MNEFEQKGYFTLPDGSKSYEVKAKSKTTRKYNKNRKYKKENSLETKHFAKITTFPIIKEEKIQAEQNSPAKAARNSDTNN